MAAVPDPDRLLLAVAVTAAVAAVPAEAAELRDADNSTLA